MEGFWMVLCELELVNLERIKEFLNDIILENIKKYV